MLLLYLIVKHYFVVIKAIAVREIHLTTHILSSFYIRQIPIFKFHESGHALIFPRYIGSL